MYEMRMHRTPSQQPQGVLLHKSASKGEKMMGWKETGEERVEKKHDRKLRRGTWDETTKRCLQDTRSPLSVQK